MNFEYSKTQNLYYDSADSAFELFELFKNNENICHDEQRNILNNEIDISINNNKLNWFEKCIL